MNEKELFKAMKTSDARNHFSDVVDTVIGKERVMFTRHGKDKAALVTTDDAEIIKYLLDKNDYEEILELAREVNAEKTNKNVESSA